MLKLNKAEKSQAIAEREQMDLLRDAYAQEVYSIAKMKGDWDFQTVAMSELYSQKGLYSETTYIGQDGKERNNWKPIGEIISILREALSDYNAAEIEDLARIYRARKAERQARDNQSGTYAERQEWQTDRGEAARPGYANAGDYEENMCLEALQRAQSNIKVLEGQLAKNPDSRSIKKRLEEQRKAEAWAAKELAAFQ